jgi:hypothetical protein
MRPRFGIPAKFAALVALFLTGIVIVSTLTLNTLRDNLLARGAPPDQPKSEQS